MRIFAVLMTATMLTACGGGGSQQLASASSVTTVAPGGTVTTTTTDAFREFATPTVSKTYAGIGGTLVYDYQTDDRNCCQQQAQQFAGRASSVRDSIFSVTYDPRDATFSLTVKDPLTGADTNTRFQDPASRTNFGGAKEPQWGVPNLTNPNYNYLQAGDGNPLSPYNASGAGGVNPGNNTFAPDGAIGSAYQSATLFYEKPGTGGTKFVSLAGFARNSLQWVEAEMTDPNNPALKVKLRVAKWHLERGAFAYGVRTEDSAVPKTGSGTYTGSMLASMVSNPTIDGAFGPVLQTYFQWIEGTSSTTVNFATGAVGLSLNGTVSKAWYDYNTGPQRVVVPQGSTFTANGTALVNLTGTGGYTGSFQDARFGTTTNGVPNAITIAGSSISGAFFGPAAEETGGGFTISGANPDQRIQISGGFKGAKP